MIAAAAWPKFVAGDFATAASADRLELDRFRIGPRAAYSIWRILPIQSTIKICMCTSSLQHTQRTRSKQLTPQPGQPLGMYACGPTVYDYGHIGNFRTFVHVDILRRFLKQQGMPLRHVMNITDVDDKIMANAAAAGQSIGDYTAKYEARISGRPGRAGHREARISGASHGTYSADGQPDRKAG